MRKEIYRVEIVHRRTQLLAAVAAVDSDEEARFIVAQIAREDGNKASDYEIKEVA